MKKLIYLFVAGTMFAFTACGNAETTTEEAASDMEEAVAEEAAVEEVAEDTTATEEAEATEETAE